MMKLKIELLSDLCTYSGETYNSVVDTDVVYDRYGLPYIPARRIKGCIREACLELRDFGCMIEIEKKDSQSRECVSVDETIFERLFGKEGNSNSAFSISNAYLEDYPKKITALMTVMDKPWMSPHKVLDMYTYTRSQTAVELESGTAQKNSLRTMRVVKKGLVFEAELLWNGEKLNEESKEFQVLRAAASIVKHIGCGRTRGLGLVSLELLPEETVETKGQNNENSQKNEEEKNKLTLDSVDTNYGYHMIKYQIDLKDPVICKAPTGNQASTQNYIAGSKILGLLAGMLGQDRYRMMTAESELIVSNAYILYGGNRTIPARNSWQKQKDQIFDEKGQMNLWEMLCEPDVSNMQMTPSKLHYVDENGVALGVDTEITYHHRRPDDKSIGRATGKDDSSFYQLESIQSGQSFGGYILADTNQAQEIIRVAGSERQVRLGYGKSAQFGDVVFRLNKIEPVQKKQEKMKDAVVTLVSDIILYNHNGVPSASIECLKEYLQEILELKKEDFQIEKKYLSFNTVGGYNTSWHTFKPVIPALGKGSVFVIHAEREFEKPEFCFVGERIQEGFGEVRFDNLPDSERYMVYKSHNNKADIKAEDIDQELLAQLKEKEEVRKLEKRIRDIVGFFEEPELLLKDGMENCQKEAAREIAMLIQKDTDGFGSAVAKLRMIYQSVLSFEDLTDQIDGIASDTARNACINLKTCVDPEKLSEEYQIRRKGNDAYRMIYHVYLTELKHLAKIAKGREKEGKKREQSDKKENRIFHTS